MGQGTRGSVVSGDSEGCCCCCCCAGGGEERVVKEVICCFSCVEESSGLLFFVCGDGATGTSSRILTVCSVVPIVDGFPSCSLNSFHIFKASLLFESGLIGVSSNVEDFGGGGRGRGDCSCLTLLVRLLTDDC